MPTSAERLTKARDAPTKQHRGRRMWLATLAMLAMPATLIGLYFPGQQIPTGQAEAERRGFMCKNHGQVCLCVCLGVCVCA